MTHSISSISTPEHTRARGGFSKLLFLLIGALVASFLGIKTAAAHDDHHPSAEETLRTTCLNRLNANTIAFDRTIPHGAVQTGTGVLAKPQTDPCDGYSWVDLPGFYGYITLNPYYTGTNINWFDDEQNAWDCNHSSIEYAVFGWVSGSYQLLSYAVMFGNYVNGNCEHDGSGFGSMGSPSASVYAGTALKVAIKSWQHNDPAINHTGAYCADINCYRPSYLFVNPEPYEYCSEEWQTCNFSGTREVRFGIYNSFTYGMATNGVACSNSIFGDPYPGYVKYCWTGLRGFSHCGNEWNSPTYCSFSGTKLVAFGARGQFTYKWVTNGTPCSNAVFGDPIVNVAKSCYVQN